MWRLIQDFFRQNWVMRGVLALGWLSILIMVMSGYLSVLDLYDMVKEMSCDWTRFPQASVCPVH